MSDITKILDGLVKDAILAYTAGSSDLKPIEEYEAAILASLWIKVEDGLPEGYYLLRVKEGIPITRHIGSIPVKMRYNIVFAFLTDGSFYIVGSPHYQKVINSGIIECMKIDFSCIYEAPTTEPKK